jgi:hypothetical protein
VLDGDQRVGRIMLAQQTREGLPWFWTTERFMQSTDDHGYTASLEQAMADFEVRWDASHPREIPQMPVQPIDPTSKVYGRMPVLLQQEFERSLGSSPAPNDDRLLIDSVAA